MFNDLRVSLNEINSIYRGDGNSFSDIFSYAINFLLGVTFAVAFVGIAFSFVQFVLSKGDKDSITKAKTALTWSVVAMLVAFFVLALKNILYRLIGVSSTYENTI